MRDSLASPNMRKARGRRAAPRDRRPGVARHRARSARVSGLDVLRMLALGADGVLIGRAWAYALAVGGEAGAAALLESFRRDLRAAVA
jgi:hypothetical protein